MSLRPNLSPFSACRQQTSQHCKFTDLCLCKPCNAASVSSPVWHAVEVHRLCLSQVPAIRCVRCTLGGGGGGVVIAQGEQQLGCVVGHQAAGHGEGPAELHPVLGLHAHQHSLPIIPQHAHSGQDSTSMIVTHF